METTNRGEEAMRNDYKVRNFLFDIIMTVITGGLWLIWIFAREMRNH